jgi:signal transduction histidine kinase
VTNLAVVDRLRSGARLLLRPSGPRPPLSRRGQVFDVVLALSLALLALVAGDNGDAEYRAPTIVPDPADPLTPPRPPPPDPFLPIEHDQTVPTLLMFLAVVAPLVLRRSYPLAVLLVVMLTATVAGENDAALRLSFYACVIAAYTAAVYSRYRLPALAAVPVAALLYTQIREPAVPTVPEDAVPFLILIPVAFAADGLRRWKRRADEGRAHLSMLEREQAEALRRAAEHERARIARELHDVVTHNVSVMVIQAGAARQVMRADPDQAREALLAVEAGGRAAMTELRHVMGLLTMDEDGAGDLTPQPGVDRLAELVRRVRATGLPVELAVTGEPRALLPGVELTVYRVVQEALTNTVKHAAGASATVVVEYAADQLRVEVTDTGGAPGPSAATGNRSGLVGLAERLAVYGGQLQAGPRVSGGYRVTARIPLEAS